MNLIYLTFNSSQNKIIYIRVEGFQIELIRQITDWHHVEHCCACLFSKLIIYSWSWPTYYFVTLNITSSYKILELKAKPFNFIQIHFSKEQCGVTRGWPHFPRIIHQTNFSYGWKKAFSVFFCNFSPNLLIYTDSRDYREIRDMRIFMKITQHTHHPTSNQFSVLENTLKLQ